MKYGQTKQQQIDNLSSEIGRLRNALDVEKNKIQSLIELMIQAGVLEYTVYGHSTFPPAGQYTAVKRETPTTQRKTR